MKLTKVNPHTPARYKDLDIDDLFVYRNMIGRVSADGLPIDLIDGAAFSMDSDDVVERAELVEIQYRAL